MSFIPYIFSISLVLKYLNDNLLFGQIPVEICNQGDSSPDLENNYLCPPYPECLNEDDIGYQDVSECNECSEMNGDINNDNIIDILDIVSTVNCILFDDCSGCSDFNEDGLTDILDIVGLVNVILDN